MSVRDRLEQALADIADPNGEGARACLTVYADAARAAADAADARAKAGISLGPLDGAIVSIKDLFDVAGEPTRAGSKILADAPPAKADAPVVRRLRAAGAVIVAKTNMSEFAFSGVGMNPHYGTPGNPADRARVPGGSSSGAAVAAADQMCEIAIGTDTGGSTRIPAALCGIVGFKPSAVARADRGRVSAVLHARLDRPDRAHGRGLRARRCRDGGRRHRAARARAGCRPAARRSAGPAAEGLGQHGRHALRRGAQEARRRGRAADRRADAAARRDDRGQRQGRLCAGGGLRDPSRASRDAAPTSSIRTCARASSAARKLSRRRLRRHVRASARG